MILPSKHLSPDRAIITVASEVFELINNRSTVSSTWNDLQEKRRGCKWKSEIPYDWFILSLDFLYLIGCIEVDNGRLTKVIE